MGLEHGRCCTPSPWREGLESCLDSALGGTSCRLFSLSGPVFLLHNEANHSYLERVTEVTCARCLVPNVSDPIGDHDLGLSVCSQEPRVVSESASWQGWGGGQEQSQE